MVVAVGGKAEAVAADGQAEVAAAAVDGKAVADGIKLIPIVMRHNRQTNTLRSRNEKRLPLNIAAN